MGLEKYLEKKHSYLIHLNEIGANHSACEGESSSSFVPEFTAL